MDNKKIADGYVQRLASVFKGHLLEVEEGGAQYEALRQLAIDVAGWLKFTNGIKHADYFLDNAGLYEDCTCLENHDHLDAECSYPEDGVDYSNLTDRKAYANYIPT
jgi:hypothetical protein